MALSYRKQLDQIKRMHESMRPHGTRVERKWSQHWCGQLSGAYCDNFGNWHVHVDDSPILWSSHTDTVHNKPGTQQVTFDHTTGDLELAEHSKSNCLGADCTAGVWLMRELVKRKVPGHYVFHYGEERGGIGSGKLARNYADWLKTFKCAIALDRRGYSDVITHQGYGRTASRDFALSLAAILGGTYKPDPTGMYTDTAEYADDIAECTNLSVGYFGAHTSAESLDCYHLLALVERLSLVRVDDLVISRKPGDWDRPVQSSLWYHGDIHWRDYNWDDVNDSDCDAAARKYAESGVAVYSSGTAGDSTNTVKWWECCYCFEVNDIRDDTCDWCGKPVCDDCKVCQDSRATRRDDSKYLDPEYGEVQRALSNTRDVPILVKGNAICPAGNGTQCCGNTPACTAALRQGTVTNVQCSCKPTKDSRGIITHSLDCAISQAIVR